MTSRCDLGAISARSPVYLGDDLGDNRGCARWHAARRMTGTCCARAGAGAMPPHRPDEARARLPPRHVGHIRVVTRSARQPEARPRAGDHWRRRLLGEGQRSGHQAEGARGMCAGCARDLRSRPISPQASEIEELLKHGAQKLFTDEHDAQIETFTQSSIESILERCATSTSGAKADEQGARCCRPFRCCCCCCCCCCCFAPRLHTHMT